jgi:hypothetical protein
MDKKAESGEPEMKRKEKDILLGITRGMGTKLPFLRVLAPDKSGNQPPAGPRENRNLPPVKLRNVS